MFSYTMTVQLEYIRHLLQFFKKYFLLCLMLSVTYYAGIIGWSLTVSETIILRAINKNLDGELFKRVSLSAEIRAP